MKAAICRESSCIVLGHGKCDICLNECPVAYIRELDRSYCRACLDIIVERKLQRMAVVVSKQKFQKTTTTESLTCAKISNLFFIMPSFGF